MLSKSVTTPSCAIGLIKGVEPLMVGLIARDLWYEHLSG